MKKNWHLCNSSLGKLSFFHALIYVDICFLLTHFFFLYYFRIIGISHLFYFNIFSVLLYAFIPVFINKIKKYTVHIVTIAMFEIILHSILSTLYVGAEYGFTLYIICLIPFPFFIDYKNDIVSYLFSGLIVLTFLILKIFPSTDLEIVDIQSDSSSYIYILNFILASIMICIFSTVFKLSKQIDRYKLKIQNESLSLLAKIDPLSQLFNRRAMIEFLKRIQSNTIQKKSKYVIVMSDLDNFKTINDTYGHSAGDLVIKNVAKIMTQCVPTEGYVCRWGGEELLFAIPDTELIKGKMIAEKIRSNVEKINFVSQSNSFHVTMTMGLCECDGSFTYERAINIADQYLYYGKTKGKNRVIDKNVFPSEILK